MPCAWETVIGKIAAKWVINSDEPNFTPSYKKPKVIAPKCEVRETARRVMKLVSVRQMFNFQIYLSHVRIWAKYFQTVLPLSFKLLWEYRALVYFLELALIPCWLVDLILYALRQLFVITQSLFKPPFIILLSFSSQFWAVKKIIIPFVSVTNHDTSQ